MFMLTLLLLFCNSSSLFMPGIVATAGMDFNLQMLQAVCVLRPLKLESGILSESGNNSKGTSTWSTDLCPQSHHDHNPIYALNQWAL